MEYINTRLTEFVTAMLRGLRGTAMLNLVEVGFYSQACSNLGPMLDWPNVCIHVFEPDPRKLHECNAAALRIPDLHFHPCALGDHSGPITMHQVPSGGSFIDGKDGPEAQNAAFNNREVNATGRVEIMCRRASEFGHLLPAHVHVLSIDAEGCEWDVLRHWPGDWPDIVSIEVGPNKPPTAKSNYRHPDMDKLQEWLDERGYEKAYHHKGDAVYSRLGGTP